MTEPFIYDEIVIASQNTGKIIEIEALLKPYYQQISSAYSLGLDDIEETGDSFAENAELKALSTARSTGRPAIADDSGLCIDALNGLPGLYTARWASQAGGFEYAIEHLLTRMASKNDRRAHMVCALSLAYPCGDVYTFIGKVQGTISWRAKGSNRIGFEPIFIPQGLSSTFASMSIDKRNELHPRACAFKQLKAHFLNTPNATLAQIYCEEVLHATL
ncbi:hypothetical protein N473_19510 [Pseudoalteromonas luteoviolacea CPMOR-1]|uniref:Uncharacterized protein n=1 Tax=Pseudoalteromonas luteoviolacea CPMOR-1 TaxID=1365248 RepID=A0A162BIE7_9GAMM|nr:non-canonical purine NTP pyrophosphatase [Pseudoalteromonas luteoviolacea]KZN62443.1 hypothetical protein N473_19510 [Pseudoalteromonas luteoviolacea CPMOR-1]